MFFTTCRQAFMSLMARAMRFLWLLVTQSIGSAYQGQFVHNSPCDRYTRCLAKRDQSAAMLAPTYSFFIFCSLVKNSPNMAYIMNALYISEFLNRLQKQFHYLFRS